MKGGQARYSDQELKRTVEEHCLLVCSRPFRDLAGLELRDRPASACPVLGLKVTPHPALLITNQENTPQTCLQDNLIGAFSPLRLSLLRWVVCVKLTKTSQNRMQASAQGPALLPGQCGQDTASCVTGWILSPVLLRAVVVSKHSANWIILLLFQALLFWDSLT